MCKLHVSDKIVDYLNSLPGEFSHKFDLLLALDVLSGKRVNKLANLREIFHKSLTTLSIGDFKLNVMDKLIELKAVELNEHEDYSLADFLKKPPRVVKPRKVKEKKEQVPENSVVNQEKDSIITGLIDRLSEMTKKFEAMEMTLTDLNNKIKSLSEKTSSVAAVDVLKPAVIETPKAKKSVVPVDYEIVPENTPKTLCMYEGCETKYFIPTKYYTNFCSDKCRNAEHKRKEDIRQAEKKALEDKARQWLDINKALVKRLGGNPHLITTTNKWLSVHDYCLNNTQEMEKGEYVFFIKRPASTFTIPKKNIGTFSVRHDPNSIPLLQRLREAWENEVIVYAAQTETKYIFIIDEPRDRIRSRDLISNVEYLDKTAKARLLDGRDVLPLDLNEFFSNKEIGK